MNSSDSDVIDVESRVVSTKVVDGSSAGAVAEATPAPQVSLEQSLVPAFDANKQIALANPAIVQLNVLKAEIAAAKVDEIDVATKDGEEKVRALLRRCVKLRTSTKAAYEAWNRPLLDAQKGVRKVIDQVNTGIEPEETRLTGIVDKIEAARKAEEERKIREEQERIAALRKKIGTLEQHVVTAVGQNSAEIDAVIRELQDLQITDDPASFGEFSDEAECKRGQAISKLLEMSAAKRAQEEERARLDAERQRQLEEQRKAEVERSLRSKIDAIKAKAFEVFGKSRAQIAAVRDDLGRMEPLAMEFGDLFAEANQAYLQVLQNVMAAYNAQENFERTQAEQRRVAAEQDAERQRLADLAAKEQQRLADEATRQRMEEEPQKRVEAPAPEPIPAPTPAPVTQQQAEGMDDTADFAVGSMPGNERSDAAIDLALSTAAPETIEAAVQEMADQFNGAPTMSTFANQADYQSARALYIAMQTWDRETAGQVVEDILETLAMGDYPTDHSSELETVSLLLAPEFIAALEVRRDALLYALNQEKVAA